MLILRAISSGWGVNCAGNVEKENSLANRPRRAYNTFMNPILIVEDVGSVREMLEVTLKFKGYSVITAIDGVEALEKIQEQMPSLVISDILMPRMDGFALVHRLRSEASTRNLPVIFVSATYTTPDDKNFAFNLGVARFIEKPIDTSDFLLTVAEILTQGSGTIRRPISDDDFYKGYRDRLEGKLRYKTTQIARTERLLQTLPAPQKPAFEAMLQEAERDRDELRKELEDLRHRLAQSKSESQPPEG
jgi:CheY-like chemotaxis protein